MPRRTKTCSPLDLLTADEARSVLSQLLAGRQELRDEAEALAGSLLARVDPDGVADDVVHTFQRLHFSAIAQRAGRHRGGYVHETDAGWELLEETLQPWLDDVARLAKGGFEGPALEQALGVLAGLHRLRTEAHAESLLGWMDANESARELAAGLVAAVAGAGVVPPQETLADAAPEWYAWDWGTRGSSPD